MNFEDVKEFMKEVGWGDLATTDGKVVGVRPMGGWAWVNSQLWCATFKASDKVKQLQKVPYAEYCFTDKEGKHVRIAGECAISENDDEKLKLYNLVPELKNYIDDPKSADYVVIILKPEKIRLMAANDLQYTEITAT